MDTVFTDCKVTVLLAQVADTAPLTTPVLDMAGYEGVAFVMGNNDGSIITGYHIEVQQDTTNGMGGAAAISGSGITFSSLTGIVTSVTDVKHITDRYVRAVITIPNCAATAVTAVTAIQYGAKTKPAVQDATTADCWTGEVNVGTGEGTA